MNTKPADAAADAPALPGEMHPDELAGQLRDYILSHVKSLRLPFVQLPAAEQKAYIDNVSGDAVEMIDMCLDCILVDGKGVVVEAKANDVSLKKESIQTVINVQYADDNLDHMSSIRHAPIKLVFAPQRDKVRSLGKAPKPDADQPAMFDDEDDAMRDDGNVKHISDALPAATKKRRRAAKSADVKPNA